MLGPGDYLHAGTVVAFADSCAGWGCWKSLPDGRRGFTTSELKINLVGTTRMPDVLICVARMLHGGELHPGLGRHRDARERRSRDRPLPLHAAAADHPKIGTADPEDGS